jgi:hypothetical protein
MELPEIYRKAKEQGRATIKTWSLTNYLFNLALSGIPVVVGWAFKMPWYQLVALFLLTLAVAFFGMVLYQSGDDRLKLTTNRIRELAEDINISGLTVQPTFQIGPARDPIKEAAFELRAMLIPSICDDYEKCLADEVPCVAAKRFLEALADTLSPSHLRS